MTGAPTPSRGLDTRWAATELQNFLSLHDRLLSRERIGYKDLDQNLIDSLMGAQELLDRILPLVYRAGFLPTRVGTAGMFTAQLSDEPCRSSNERGRSKSALVTHRR